MAQQWQVKVPADLAFLSAFPAFMRPGEPVYVTSAQDSALDRRPSLSILYYHQDRLGSSAIIADAAGNIVDETVNYPFGYPRHHDRPAAARAVLPSRYGFTQKEQDDESGLHYFEARYLVATLGRFASVDPLASTTQPTWLEWPQRENPYAYALDNPVGLVDPNDMTLSSVERPRVRLARMVLLPQREDSTFNLAVEDDVILGDPTCDVSRVAETLKRVTDDADRLEMQLFAGRDATIDTFKQSIDDENKEPT